MFSVCLYMNVPLSTHSKIRYVSKFTMASRGNFLCDITAFLCYYTFCILYFVLQVFVFATKNSGLLTPQFCRRVFMPSCRVNRKPTVSRDLENLQRVVPKCSVAHAIHHRRRQIGCSKLARNMTAERGPLRELSSARMSLMG